MGSQVVLLIGLSVAWPTWGRRGRGLEALLSRPRMAELDTKGGIIQETRFDKLSSAVSAVHTNIPGKGQECYVGLPCERVGD